MQAISNRSVLLPCSLNRKMALRFMGYRGQKPDEQLTDEFERIALTCENLHPVRATWHTFALDDPRLKLPGDSIARFLDGATHATLMACTLGMDSERELNRVEAQGALVALMTDACMSALIEAGADACQNAVEAQAQAAGLVCGKKRFSPGYGDYPIELQRDFLDTIDATKNIGLFTTESHMLVPTKSITAIIPIYSNCQAAIDRP